MTSHQEMKADVLKIFLPVQCLHERSGLLVGLEHRKQTTVCVTALVKTSTYKDKGSIDKWLSCKTSAEHRITVVGVWENVISKQKTNGYMLHKPQLPLERWFCLRKTRDIPQCVLHGAWPTAMTTEDVVIILYDARMLFESYYLMGRAMDVQVQSGVAIKPLTDITLVAYSLLIYNKLAKSTCHFDIPVADFVHKYKWHRSRFLDGAHSQLIHVLLWMISVISWVSSSRQVFRYHVTWPKFYMLYIRKLGSYIIYKLSASWSQIETVMIFSINILTSTLVFV